MSAIPHHISSIKPEEVCANSVLIAHYHIYFRPFEPGHQPDPIENIRAPIPLFKNDMLPNMGPQKTSNASPIEQERTRGSHF